MAKDSPRCGVFVPDPDDTRFEKECGKPGVGHVTVPLPAGRGTANVAVCSLHKSIINSHAAKLRAEAKVR